MIGVEVRDELIEILAVALFDSTRCIRDSSSSQPKVISIVSHFTPITNPGTYYFGVYSGVAHFRQGATLTEDKMKILQLLFSTAIFATLSATQSFSDDLSFVGDWRNVDTSTRNLTRINIFPVNQIFVQVRARAFGRCHPSNCDWGTEDGHGGPNDRTLIVDYPAKAHDGTIFAQRKLTLTFDGPSPPTRMNYLLNTHYVDFSGRPDWIRRGQLRLP